MIQLIIKVTNEKSFEIQFIKMVFFNLSIIRVTLYDTSLKYKIARCSPPVNSLDTVKCIRGVIQCHYLYLFSTNISVFVFGSVT